MSMPDMDVDAAIADLPVQVGLQYARSGELAEAERWLRLALALAPEHPGALTALGDVLRRSGRLAEAMPMLEAAVRLAPGFADAWLNLGVARHESDQLDEAISLLRTAIGLNPEDARAHNNLGLVYKLQGRIDLALSCLDEAVRIAPDFQEARANRALALLLSGDFEAGWREYEWREKPAMRVDRPLSEHLREGKALEGKTVLLQAEQGLGDLIQFVRYAATLDEMGARVLVECPARARALIETARGVAETVEWGAPPPPSDLNAHLLSLPWMLHPREAAAPVQVPYLHPDARRVEAWRRRIGNEERLRVGVVWAGQEGNAYDRRRSIPAAELTPLLQEPAVKVYALQRGPRAADLAGLPEDVRVENLEQEDGDLIDTAAVILNLDLLISADTMAAHLAGALGRPVWLLLPFAPDWRWMTAREDSPWYPTMRLFRQPSPGDWTSVIRQAVAALREARPHLLASRARVGLNKLASLGR